jgi:hypothetical protein
MPAPSKPGDTTSDVVSRRPSVTDPRGRTTVQSQNPALTCAVAWLVPGAGHFLVGRMGKAAVLFAVLTFMYALGLVLGGRLFPLQWSDPIVFLSALAEWSLGLPRLAAWIGGFGQGQVVAASYEYGNTFLIVGGLLNTLAILDAYDIATGRKPA